MFFIRLDENNRVASVTEEDHGDESLIKVERLPAEIETLSKIHKYRYENGVFIYDPEPESEPVEVEPTANEILNALLGVE